VAQDRQKIVLGTVCLFPGCLSTLGRVLRGAQISLRPFSVGDILGEDQNTVQRAIVLPHALYPKAGVQYCAVLANKPFIHHKALDNAVQHAMDLDVLKRQIVGIGQFSPSLPGQFLFRVAQQPAEAMVDFDPFLLLR